MKNVPLSWQVHKSPEYNAKMTERCSQLQVDIVNNSERRRSIFADPRSLHKELFADFTPAGYPEYAGMYRGTPKTTLAARRISAKSQLHPDSEFEFVSPRDVKARMEETLETTRTLLIEHYEDDFGKLIALTYTFCWFGKIHPFLDGNGHVQRALFAAMATEFGYPLTDRFAIHPRPYDRLFATALEIFTCSEKGSENSELGVPAEYLAFFLGGPFDAPRKNLSADTLDA